MRNVQSVILAAALVLLPLAGWADIARFVGSYSGSAEVELSDGSRQARDMSVTVTELRDGFSVKWTSTRFREDGRKNSKTYQVNFLPTERPGVYAAAQQRNVFGHKVPLDPMRGEPYVWARLMDDTLSVYSLFVTDDGSYEMQQYDRTLVEDGLRLDFARFADGAALRSVTTVL
ncbi:MAG: hypothetical protein AAGF60_15380, partial [Pseudomonadota bacterium]